jgi:cyclophilin family peptidyl-prolyl cis-trans isomerase
LGASAHNRRATVFVLALATTLALAGCGGDDESEPAPTTETARTDCEAVDPAAPKKVDLKAPKGRIGAEGASATVETNCGSFVIELDRRVAPKTTSSFAYQVEEGVYDGTAIQRVVPGFLVQGGDPTATGDGDAGYTVIERPPPNTAYTEGTVAMAKSAVEPDGASGSQFFVVTAVDAGLPPQYALLGEVTKGFDTLKRIEAQAPADPAAGEEPVMPVVISRITLDR